MKRNMLFFIFFIGITSNVFSKEFELKECIDIALKNNADLLRAKGSYKSSKAKLGESRSSYWPQISLGFSATKKVSPLSSTFGESAISFPGLPSDLDVTTYYTGIQLQQNIWDFGRTSSIERIAYLNEGLSGLNIEKKEFEITFQVKRAYYNILQAQSLETIAKTNLKEMEYLFNAVKERKNQGLATEVDVLNVEAQYYNFKLQLEKASNQIEITKASLVNVLGLPDTEEFDVKDFVFSEPSEFPFGFKNYEECKNYALKNKIEFKEVDYQHDIAKANVSAADSEWLPQIVGQAEYDFTDNTMAFKNKTWQIGISISMPIFDGFRKIAKQDYANSELKNVESVRKQTEQNVLLQIKTNYLKVHEEQENIKVIRKKAEYCRRNHEAVLAKYEQGLATLNDLIEAQTKKLNSDLEIQQSIYMYHIALNELEYALGGMR